ncbi:MAG: hypothetical protein M1826_000930 [Phylliscum demangeonii]|nr:MAG: hypothetical protein M1826_000930 [Phylliscum demangeonii]
MRFSYLAVSTATLALQGALIAAAPATNGPLAAILYTQCVNHFKQFADAPGRCIRILKRERPNDDVEEWGKFIPRHVAFWDASTFYRECVLSNPELPSVFAQPVDEVLAFCHGLTRVHFRTQEIVTRGVVKPRPSGQLSAAQKSDMWLFSSPELKKLNSAAHHAAHQVAGSFAPITRSIQKDIVPAVERAAGRSERL